MKTAHDFMNVSLLSIGYVCNGHHWRSEIISSPFTRIYLVKEGRAWIHLPNREMELKPGYLYQVPAFVSHRYECEPGFSVHSVNDISREVGIKEVSYFIRVFKRHTGFTPQHYREVFR